MRIALVILFLISAVTSFSQRYNIELFGIKNGLLHSLVTGIDQDEQGRIWLSTGGGLCCYNGFEFKYLTTREVLNYTRLTDVVVDGIGNIWTGSLFGLNMVSGNKIFYSKRFNWRGCFTR
jgi:ligand-binding sensor domain-containing protein